MVQAPEIVNAQQADFQQNVLVTISIIIVLLLVLLVLVTLVTFYLRKT